MVARPWGWDTPFMLGHFGVRAIVAILLSNTLYFLLFRRELRGLASHPAVADIEQPDEEAIARIWSASRSTGFTCGWDATTTHSCCCANATKN